MLKKAGIVLVALGFLLPSLILSISLSQGVVMAMAVLQLAALAVGAALWWKGTRVSAAADRYIVNAVGVLWQAAGIVLMVAPWPLLIALFAIYGSPQRSHFIEILLGGLPFIAAGRYCHQRGLRHRIRSADEVMRLDPRPPVLYLRSFKDDPAAAANPLWRAFFAPTAWVYSMAGEEQQVAEVFNEIGPFIGIGRPGSTLPEVGAARMYVAEAEWKSKVRELAERSRLVAFRLGNTPGFWWEIQTVLKMLPPEKVVFMLPFGRDRYERFRAEAAKYLPQALPEFPVGAVGDAVDHIVAGADGLGTLKALLFFEKAWVPRLALLSAAPVEVKGGKRIVAALKASLSPVVRQLGVSWKTAPVMAGERPFVTVAEAILSGLLLLAAIAAVVGWMSLKA